VPASADVWILKVCSGWQRWTEELEYQFSWFAFKECAKRPEETELKCQFSWIARTKPTNGTELQSCNFSSVNCMDCTKWTFSEPSSVHFTKWAKFSSFLYTRLRCWCCRICEERLERLNVVGWSISRCRPATVAHWMSSLPYKLCSSCNSYICYLQ